MSAVFVPENDGQCITGFMVNDSAMSINLHYQEAVSYTHLVPQLFRNHLVPFKQTEGIVIFVLIDKYIHSRDITRCV